MSSSRPRLPPSPSKASERLPRYPAGVLRPVPPVARRKLPAVDEVAMPTTRTPTDRLHGPRHLPPHADSHHFTNIRPVPSNQEGRGLVTVAPHKRGQVTHGLESRDYSFCCAGAWRKPRGRTSFLETRRTRTLHDTSNGLSEKPSSHWTSPVLAQASSATSQGSMSWGGRPREPRPCSW